MYVAEAESAVKLEQPPGCANTVIAEAVEEALNPT